MTQHLQQNSHELLQAQKVMEAHLLRMMQDFEKTTGLCIHALKVHRGEMRNDKRQIVAIELSAQLR